MGDQESIARRGFRKLAPPWAPAGCAGETALSLTMAATLAAGQPGPVATVINAVALSLPAWMVWWWPSRRGMNPAVGGPAAQQGGAVDAG